MKYLTIKTALIFVIISSLTCCSSDDDKVNDDPSNSLTLSIELQTAEDQMTGFADNAMAILDSKVYSIAGINDGSDPNFHHDVWSSNNGIVWISIADNFPFERRGTTLTEFNNEIWCIAGENNAGNGLGDIWSSTDGETWMLRESALQFGPIKFHSTVVYNNVMYVIFGNATTNLTEVWSSPNGTTWTQLTANAHIDFVGQGGYKAIVFNNAIYVMGGETSTNVKLNDVWTSTNGIDWTKVATTGEVFPVIVGHTATVYNNKVWVIGGRAGTANVSNDIYYSSDMVAWKKYSSTVPFDKIAFHNTLNYNNALWVFGGYKESGLSSAIWKIEEL